MARDQEITKHSRIFTKPELPFYLTIWCTVFLSALGLTMVLSASTVTSLQENGNSYTIFLRQTLFLLIGFAVAYWAYRVKGVFWIQVAKFSLIISIFTLLLPFISFIGKDVKGNRNWIEFAGFTLQPSEFAKFGLILWCALLLRNFDFHTEGKKKIISLLPAFVIVEAIILIQKDLGTALLILLIFSGMVFISGAPAKWFISLLILGIAIGSAFVFSSTYRMNRFGALFDPFDEKYYKFSGWQPAHSIMGMASGGLWGSGLGASKQKWSNLAEAHTDFIFSVIGEELGLLGTLMVLGLYTSLIYAIIRIALKTKDNFSRYATAAVACWFIAQVTINIGSAISLIPVIGVTLPLISYGGSSLLANLLAIGFVLSVARRTPEIAFGIKQRQLRKLQP